MSDAPKDPQAEQNPDSSAAAGGQHEAGVPPVPQDAAGDALNGKADANKATTAGANTPDANPADANTADANAADVSGHDPAGEAKNAATAGEAKDAEAGETAADAADTTAALPAATDPAATDPAATDPATLPAQSTPSLPAEAAADATSDETAAGKPMTLMEHLDELRIRLVRCSIAVGLGFFICWAVVDPLFDTLVNPLLKVLPANSTAIYTTLPEGFFTRMYIAFVAGVFVSSPMIFYQVWSFIAPGLYDDEKRFIIPVAVTSGLFFICGGAFCYFVVFPYAFSFFVSFSTDTVVTMPRVSDYLDFVLKLLLAFGLIFEMPLFAFFLARMGLVTATMMRKVRRYAVLVIFIVAAILTPPDVVSQLLMACPMLLLYELSILVAATFGRKKAPADGEGTPGKPDDNPKNDKAEAA